jgi:hypothetical protein
MAAEQHKYLGRRYILTQWAKAVQLLPNDPDAVPPMQQSLL